MAAEAVEAPKDFSELRLDDRLLNAIHNVLGYPTPTPVQEKAIPEALNGKDVLCRARTGSGKTAAYLIPVIQNILNKKESDMSSASPGIRSLVLVPTRELCKQVEEVAEKLASNCRDLVSSLQLGSEVKLETQRARLADKPDIVISTPSRILQFVNDGTVSLKELEMLVIDEADLILSYGYQEDLAAIRAAISTTYQAILMSATLSPEVESLKKLILHNPVTLKLATEDGEAKLQQFFLYVPDVDKYLLMFALLRLRLIRGKVIIFVNTVERCYRLKLFFERLALKAAVLNCELPVNSRYHIVQEFNKGVFDYIIATDEANAGDMSEEEEEGAKGEEKEDEDEEERPKKKKKTASGAAAPTGPKWATKDDEYGVSRGIDFKDVDTVINFDFPKAVRTYVHRIGRTARAGSRGTALSLATPGGADDDVLGQLQAMKKSEDGTIVDMQPFKFKLKELEAFRYRVEDVLRGITKNAVRQARIAEIRSELLNSEKLKAHFEDNPHDLDALRHDVSLIPAQVPRHLKRLPKYLVPQSLANAARQQAPAKPAAPKPKSNQAKRQAQKEKKKADPLKSFAVGGGKKRKR